MGIAGPLALPNIHQPTHSIYAPQLHLLPERDLTMSDLLESFNDTDLLDLIEHPDEMTVLSNTTTIERGVPTPFTSIVNGVSYPFTFLLNSARLTRLTKTVNPKMDLSTNTMGGYNVMSGVLSNVDAVVEVEVEGKMIDFNEFLRLMLNARTEDPARHIGAEQFAKASALAGFRFNQPGMTMLIQHMGASENSFNNVFAAFEAAGAVDGMHTIPQGKINNIRAVRIHKPGLPISSMEISTADRSKSRSGEHGFQDFVEAGVNNLIRTLSLRMEARLLKAKIGELDDSVDLEERQMLEGELRNVNRQASSWTTNWGGVQERIQVNDDGTMDRLGIWDGVQVPCGRFSVERPLMIELRDKDGELVRDDDTGNIIMTRKREPLRDEDETVMVDEESGKVLTKPASEILEFDFWKSSGDTTDGPDLSPKEKEVDATMVGVAGTAAALPVETNPDGSTKIPDADDF